MAKKPIERLTSNELPEAVAIWVEADAALTAAKKAEMAARLKVAEAFAGKPEGVNTGELMDGTLVKCDIKINRKVIEAQYQAAMAYAVEKNNTHLQGILQKVVRFRPEVNVGDFKQLHFEDKKLLGDIVQETVGTPSVEVKFKED